MPEVNQYLFSRNELIELLIKSANVHEGRWMLMGNFGFSPGNYGPTPDTMVPGSVVAVLQVGILRSPPENPPEMSVDAAVVNPIAKGKKG